MPVIVSRDTMGVGVHVDEVGEVAGVVACQR
jgi:hypothetical protein